MTQTQLDFSGSTFSKSQDGPRLGRQLEAVKKYMLQGGRYTLQQISEAVGSPQASTSARLRDLRRLGMKVEKARVPGQKGLWVYWLVIN